MNGLDYLTDVRKLPIDVLLELQVDGVEHPALGAAARFPYVRAGKPYAAKFRATGDGFKGERYRASKGIHRGVYNEDALDLPVSLPIIITEGEIDAISVIAAGHERCISMPDGFDPKGQGGETQGKMATLEAERQRLLRSPYVVVAGDADAAGEGLPEAVSRLLIGHDVRRASWPEGCKDANDVWCKHGADELRACIDTAERIDPVGGRIGYIGDNAQRSSQEVLRPDDDDFRNILAFEIGQISVLTGRPGEGKSTFAEFCAALLVRAKVCRAGMLMFESHHDQVQDHMTLMLCGQRYRDMTLAQRADAVRKIGRDIVIVDRIMGGDTQYNLGWLYDMLRVLVYREGCRFIVVDPWNEMEHMPERGENMSHYVNWALAQIRNWAAEMSCHIMIVAHPKKMSEKKAMPDGYDVADSAAFANKPALGLTVQEGKEMGEVDLLVWKVRNRSLYGVWRRTVSLQFDSGMEVYRLAR